VIIVVQDIETHNQLGGLQSCLDHPTILSPLPRYYKLHDLSNDEEKSSDGCQNL
jgi:hypothetical protein